MSHDDKYLYEDEDIDIESYICICTAGWSGRHCEGNFKKTKIKMYMQKIYSKGRLGLWYFIINLF